jgi:hypothetical protein
MLRKRVATLQARQPFCVWGLAEDGPRSYCCAFHVLVAVLVHVAVRVRVSVPDGSLRFSTPLSREHPSDRWQPTHAMPLPAALASRPMMLLRSAPRRRARVCLAVMARPHREPPCCLEPSLEGASSSGERSSHRAPRSSQARKRRLSRCPAPDRASVQTGDCKLRTIFSTRLRGRNGTARAPNALRTPVMTTRRLR